MRHSDIPPLHLSFCLWQASQATALRILGNLFIIGSRLYAGVVAGLGFLTRSESKQAVSLEGTCDPSGDGSCNIAEAGSGM